MSLSAGENLGPYEIVELIGQGGMGEVYRARDPRLNREVAVKVSAQQFGERFEREAKVVASLNHPNICHLYDVGPNYLVMELVEGPTLAERIQEGSILLDESLAIARQIADALDVAHEKGIVHRDLKPGNVKIKPDGVVKVLDFGLAKTGGTPAMSSENSPTLTMAHSQTQAGVILARRRTWRLSRPRASRWTSAPISTHSVCCCTKCLPASGCIAGRRPLRF